MPHITRESLMTLESYSRIRATFRSEIIAHKKNRFVMLGEHISLARWAGTLLIVAAVLYALEAGGPKLLGVPVATWIAGLGGLWALLAAWPRR